MNPQERLDVWTSIQTAYPLSETSVAWADPSSTLRWSDLSHRVSSLRGPLAARGLGVGQRALICLPWEAELLVSWLAVHSVGGIAVVFSPSLSNEEIFRWANASEAIAEIIDEDLCQRLGKSLQRRTRHQVGILLGAEIPEGWLSWNELASRHAGDPASPEVLPSTDALITLTPGTIRAPRGLLFSNRALHDAASRIALLLENAGLAKQPILFSLPQDITSLSLILGIWKAGGSALCLPPEMLASSSAHAWLQEVRPAAWFASTPLLSALPTALASSLPASLRRVVLLGEDTEAKTLPGTSIPVVKGYNVAEYGGLLAWGDASSPTVGRFPETAEASIVGRDRRPIRPGSQGAGEILLRGPGLASAQIQAEGDVVGLTNDEGWLPTEDLASQTPQGEILLRGRVTDLLEEAGERFSCKEVESVLQKHPQVLAVAFYRTSGQTPVLKACIEAAPDRFGRPLNVYAVTEHLRHVLPHTMLPKLVEFRSPLPRNLAGKIARWQLR